MKEKDLALLSAISGIPVIESPYIKEPIIMIPQGGLKELIKRIENLINKPCLNK